MAQAAEVPASYAIQSSMPRHFQSAWVTWNELYAGCGNDWSTARRLWDDHKNMNITSMSTDGQDRIMIIICWQNVTAPFPPRAFCRFRADIAQDLRAREPASRPAVLKDREATRPAVLEDQGAQFSYPSSPTGKKGEKERESGP